MSEESKRALDEAIRTHLADEGQGDVTTAWLLISGSLTAADPDDEGKVWMEQADGQPRYVSLGLLEAGAIFHRGFVYSVMTKNELEGDDD